MSRIHPGTKRSSIRNCSRNSPVVRVWIHGRDGWTVFMSASRCSLLNHQNVADRRHCVPLHIVNRRASFGKDALTCCGESDTNFGSYQHAQRLTYRLDIMFFGSVGRQPCGGYLRRQARSCHGEHDRHRDRGRWQDERARSWKTLPSLTATIPLLASVEVEGRRIIERAQPFYRARRQPKADAAASTLFSIFLLPHPDGTRSFCYLSSQASDGEIDRRPRRDLFRRHGAWHLHGGLRAISFIPVAASSSNRRSWSPMSPIPPTSTTPGALKEGKTARRRIDGIPCQLFRHRGEVPDVGSRLRIGTATLKVRYRAIAAHSGAGSVAVFPPPHAYIMPRDYTTNMGYVWYTSWRGFVSLGIGQIAQR